jgi:hypothetical protein
MGRDYRSHIDWSQKGSRTFKPEPAFFEVSGTNFGADFFSLPGNRPHHRGLRAIWLKA